MKKLVVSMMLSMASITLSHAVEEQTVTFAQADGSLPVFGKLVDSLIIGMEPKVSKLSAEDLSSLREQAVREITRENFWQNHPAQWETHRNDSMVGPGIADKETTLFQLKQDALNCVPGAGKSLLQAYLSGHFGIDSENIHVREEAENLYRIFSSVAVDDLSELVPQLKKWGIFYSTINDETMTKLFGELAGKPSDPALKAKAATYPFCYALACLKDPVPDDEESYGWGVKERYTFDRDAIPTLTNANKLTKYLAGQNVQRTSTTYLEYALHSGLTELVTGEQKTQECDGETSPNIYNGKVTLGELKRRAFDLDFGAFKLLMESYRQGYFGIPKKFEEVRKEAADWLALFSLTGKANFLLFHAQTLTENWFSTVHTGRGLFMAEKTALAYAAEQGDKEAAWLASFLPFSYSRITWEGMRQSYNSWLTQ